MGHRLLVVDSDRRFLQDHSATLESAFEVDFRDGTEGALAQLETGVYAAALLCVEASENKGYSLCSAIRRSPGLADLKVALISAKATDEEYARHQSLKGRADLYLHKPIRPNTLVSALAPLVPLKTVDPDSPLGDLGGGDLGEEWLESLRSELETEPAAAPRPTPRPAPQAPVQAAAVPAPAAAPIPALSSVSAVLGFTRPLPPLPSQPPPLQVSREAGRMELLEARVQDLETKLVASANQLEAKTRDLEELRLQGEAAQSLFEEKTLRAMELENQLAAANEALERSRQDLEDGRQQEESARTELREKTQLTMDLMESNQLLQAQLAEAREDLERLSRSERALLVRNQELELERDELREARSQMEAGLNDLGRKQAALEETHERQKMELLAAVDEREARLVRLEASLVAQREQVQILEQQRDSASGQLQDRSERLQAVNGKLTDLADQIRQALELTRIEMN
jgi:CheY-like chemotaxis protein